MRRAAFLRHVVQPTAAPHRREGSRSTGWRCGCAGVRAARDRIVEAIDVVKQVSRSSQVNALGFCVVVTRTSEEFEL